MGVFHKLQKLLGMQHNQPLPLPVEDKLLCSFMFKEHGTYTHLIQVQGTQGLGEKDEKKNPSSFKMVFSC